MTELWRVGGDRRLVSDGCDGAPVVIDGCCFYFFCQGEWADFF